MLVEEHLRVTGRKYGSKKVKKKSRNVLGALKILHALLPEPIAVG